MVKLQNNVELAGQPHFFPEQNNIINSWYENPAGKALILKSPHGGGKTQLVVRALDSFEVIRIVCLPGMFAGEILEELGLAFFCMGEDRLYKVLCEDPAFNIKLEMVREILSDLDICLWFDDIDSLEKGDFKNFQGPKKEQYELFKVITETVHKKMRLIITACENYTLGDMFNDLSYNELLLPALSGREIYSFWRTVARGKENPPSNARTPLELQLAGSLVSRGKDVSEGSLSSLLPLIWEELGEEAQNILMACVVADSRITTGLIHFVERETGCVEEPFSKLIRMGLFESGGQESNRYFINPSIASFVSDRILNSGNEYFAQLESLGNFWEQAGKKSRRIWDLLRAIKLYSKVGAIDSLYGLQRKVIENLLRRGYLYLSEMILNQTVDKVSDSKRAVVLGNLAIVKKNQGDYDTALDYYEQARMTFEELHDQPNAARVLHQLGNIYYMKGELDVAVRYYEKSQEIAVDCGDESVAAAAQIQVANVLFLKSEFDRAAYHYQEGLKYSEKMGDQRMELAVLLQLGQIYFAQKKFLDAEEVFQHADKLSEKVSDYPSKGKILQFKGLIARSRGDLERASKFFSSVIELSRKLKDPELEGASAFHLGNSKMAQGDCVASLQALVKALEIFVTNKLDMVNIQSVVSAIRKLSQQVGKDRFKQIAKEAKIDWDLIKSILAGDKAEG